MGTTTGNLGLEYPDLRGRGIAWAAMYEANLNKIEEHVSDLEDTQPTILKYSDDTLAVEATDSSLNIKGKGATGIVSIEAVAGVEISSDDLSAAIPFSQSGITGLSPNFIATSIVGCLNELKDSEVITTSNDGTTAMTSASPTEGLFTGSGSNHVFSLPDATTLYEGRRFVRTNASSKVVIIKNDGVASSCFELVAPGAIITLICTDISTAAGGWKAISDSDQWPDATGAPYFVGIGDSTIAGFGGATSWFDQLMGKVGASSLFANLGVNGSTTTGMIDKIVRALGVVEWNFLDGAYPGWSGQGGTTLAVDNQRLKITRDASYGRALLAVLEIGSEYTVSGEWAGDGTSNPVLVDAGFGDLATGTSSITKQTFTSTFTAASITLRVDCRAGGNGNFVYLSKLKVEKTSKATAATRDLFILSGVNDIGYSVPFETTKSNLQFVWKKALDVGVRPVTMLPIPWNVQGVNKDALLQIVRWIRATAPGPVLDAYAYGDGDYNQTTDTQDGTHPTTTGNTTIMDLAMAQLYAKKTMIDKSVDLQSGDPEVVITSNDGTHAMGAASADEGIFEGSGSNFVVSLPDATKLKKGRRFVRTNASSQVVIVKNNGAASSAMYWLVPGDTLIAECSGTGSAAGTWELSVIEAPVHKVERFETDFIESLTTSAATPFFRSLTSGGGTVMAAVDAAGVLAGGVGLYSIGNSVGGYSAHLAPGLPNLLLGSGAVLLEFDMGHSALSVVAEEYIHRVGLGDSVNASDNVDGVYFEYDRLNTTDGLDYWKIVTSSNSTRTKTETTATPTLYTSSLQRMTIVVNSDGTRVDFWINETHVGTHTTNIPTGVSRVVSVSFEGTKTAGTGYIYAGPGYMRYAKAHTTRR